METSEIIKAGVQGLKLVRDHLYESRKVDLTTKGQFIAKFERKKLKSETYL
jgi:hypothetical protein